MRIEIELYDSAEPKTFETPLYSLNVVVDRISVLERLLAGAQLAWKYLFLGVVS